MQAWAAAQLAEFQRSAHEETIAAQYAEYLAEQFQAQMAVRALQEQQDDALAAAALAAAEYEQNHLWVSKLIIKSQVHQVLIIFTSMLTYIIYQGHSCLQLLKRKHMHSYTSMTLPSSCRSDKEIIPTLILLS